MSDLHYGGQAVMEGVMMRGTTTVAVAVRAPGGQIVVHSEPLNRAIYGTWVARVPFVRGVTMLWDTLILGMRMLMYSADIVVGEQIEQRTPAQPAKPSESMLTRSVAWGSVALAMAMAVGLFFLLPALLTRLLDRYIAWAVLSNLVEGLIRLTFVLAYIWGVGFLPDVRRVFQYHGAEHKTIHAYEAGEPLTVEAIRPHTTAHARCGTAFMLVVVVISVLIFALLGRPSLWVRLASRILLIPVIVSISYEWLKFSARHSESVWMRALLVPGLALQKLTTREPDEAMIKVAIAALKRVLEKEGLPVPGGDPA